MNEPGFNPIWWDCDTFGCWNKKCRSKIEMFADCFPGKINFGDVEGLVELRGYFALLEWKHPGSSLPDGQRIAHEQFSRFSGNVVFFVHGVAETMQVVDYRLFWRGTLRRQRDASFAELHARVKAWADWVLTLPRRI